MAPSAGDYLCQPRYLHAVESAGRLRLGVSGCVPCQGNPEIIYELVPALAKGAARAWGERKERLGLWGEEESGLGRCQHRVSIRSLKYGPRIVQSASPVLRRPLQLLEPAGTAGSRHGLDGTVRPCQP